MPKWAPPAAGSAARKAQKGRKYLGPHETYPYTDLHGNPTKQGLLAAERRANMNGDSSIASRARSLLKKHFGVGEDKAAKK